MLLNKMITNLLSFDIVEDFNFFIWMYVTVSRFHLYKIKEIRINCQACCIPLMIEHIFKFSDTVR